MKVVLDTNVLIAALIAQGVCADLLEHCVLRHTIVSSEAILAELRKHLINKFNYSVEETDDVLTLFRSEMEVVTPDDLEPPVCRDPDDDVILATAIAGSAACIVTGDKDLLVLKQHQQFEIVRPADFAAFEASQGHR